MSEHNKVGDAASFAISYEESDTQMKMNDVELGEATEDHIQLDFLSQEISTLVAEVSDDESDSSLDGSLDATNDAADEIYGFDPKRQKKLSRYVAAGLGVFVVVSFLIIGGAVGLFRSGEPSDVNVDPSTVPMGENWIIRVSAGATENYIDPSGREWLRDDLENPSDLFSVIGEDTWTHEDCPMEIANSDYAGPGLYCNERTFGAEGKYEIPVPSDGIYEFTLHFADIFFDEPGKREFEVKVENQMMNRHYDIVKAAPRGGNTAKRMHHEQPVTDGSATITLRSLAGMQRAKISAFEVRRIADLP